MGKKLQSIYDYLNEYSKESINKAIEFLTLEEQHLVKLRYGDDLQNPISATGWTKEMGTKFYNCVIPKIKKIIAEEEAKAFSKMENSKETPPNETKIVTPHIATYEKELLYELLSKEVSNKELCEKLNITPNELYAKLLDLKNKGINQIRRYYSDGTIKYKRAISTKDLTSIVKKQDVTLITGEKENKLRVLLLSDLHFGSDLERIDLVNRAFDYCVKNGINVILSGGDLIDGSFSKGIKREVPEILKQVEYFLNNYPSDKSILTFSVAGDHDLSALKTAAIDIVEVCRNYRHDIVIGGYNNTNINIKNDKVHLYHHSNYGEMFTTSASIILHGHSHQYFAEIKNNVLNVTMPSLSEINQPVPSVLELYIDFVNGFISNARIKHIALGNTDTILSEINFDLSKKTHQNDEKIQNTEVFKTPSKMVSTPPLVLSKKEERSLSQIDKFNKRYHF